MSVTIALLHSTIGRTSLAQKELQVKFVMDGSRDELNTMYAVLDKLPGIGRLSFRLAKLGHYRES